MANFSTNSAFYGQTAGLILAGGEARRLGGARKSGLRLGGLSLIERTSRIMRSQCASLFAATAGHTAPECASIDGLMVLADPGTGPAAALLTCASMIAEAEPHAEYLLVAPVDAPFAPDDFADRASQLLDENTHAVIGTNGSGTYPTHAVWCMAELERLSRHIPDPAGYSLFALLDQTRWMTVEFAAEDGGNPFSNINTPADLVASARRLQMLN